MTPEQIREVVQRVDVATWWAAERYLRRTRREFTPMEHAITHSRFTGAVIDYLNRGNKILASELLRDAASIEDALQVLQKYDAMFASHAQLLDPGAIRAAMKSFAGGLRRGARELKKYPVSRGFFYCVGGRFKGEEAPSAEEAHEVYVALVRAVDSISPSDKVPSDYTLPNDGATIRMAIEAGQGRK